MEGFLRNMESLPRILVSHPSDMGGYPITTEYLPKNMESVLLNIVSYLRNIKNLSRKIESHPLNMEGHSRTKESYPCLMDDFAPK
jgi:hypothetical protein